MIDLFGSRARRTAARDRLVAELSQAQRLDEGEVPTNPKSAPRSWLVGADLRGADLRHADLERADLRGADLRGADLRHGQFSHGLLVDADLRDALLDYADFSWSNLEGAQCAGASLYRTRVVEATFHGADLSGVDLRTVTGLTDGCLKSLRTDATTRWPLGFDPTDPRVGGPVIHRGRGRT